MARDFHAHFLPMDAAFTGWIGFSIFYFFFVTRFLSFFSRNRSSSWICSSENTMFNEETLFRARRTRMTVEKDTSLPDSKLYSVLLLIPAFFGDVFLHHGGIDPHLLESFTYNPQNLFIREHYGYIHRSTPPMQTRSYRRMPVRQLWSLPSSHESAGQRSAGNACSISFPKNLAEPCNLWISFLVANADSQ